MRPPENRKPRSAFGVVLCLSQAMLATCPATTCASQLFGSEYIALELTGPARLPHYIDLDADGTKDIVAAEQAAIIFRMGLGSGRFSECRALAIRGQVYDFAAADLDRDGLIDIAAVDYIYGVVAVFRGRGNGLFTPRTEIAIGRNPQGIAIGDVNGDGWPDIAAGRSPVAILLGREDGEFDVGPSISMYLEDCFLLQDLDEDGDLDLAGLRTSYLVVCPGFGNGVFAEPISFASGSYPKSLAFAHLDSDTHLDAVVANFDSKSVSIFIGRGDGTFEAQMQFPAGIIPREARPADLDHDGVPDLAVASQNTDELLVLRGLGGGHFAAPVAYRSGFQPCGLVVDDVDGDGNADALVTAGSIVALHYGNSNGSFGTGLRQPVGREPVGLVLGFLDQDSQIDVAVTHVSGGTVQPLFGNGNGTFRAGLPAAVGAGPWEIALGELTYHSGPDVAVASHEAVTLLSVASDGSLGSRYELLQGRGYYAPTAGKLTTGDRDVLVLTQRDVGLVVVSLTRVLRLSLPGISGNAVIMDANGDGIPDLVTVGAARIHTFPGDGNGGFGTAVVSAQPVLGGKLVTGDWTLDGITDLALMSGWGVQFLGGRGDGKFDILPGIHVANPADILAADLDSDGRTDFAAIESSNGAVAVWLANGDGTLRALDKHGIGFGTGRLVAADVDNNGSLDLVTTNRPWNEISVLLNRSERTPLVVEDLEANPTDRGVLLTWSLSIEELASCEVVVERAFMRQGPFEPLAAPLPATRHMTFLDPMPMTGSAWYRIQVQGVSGLLASGGPVEVQFTNPIRVGSLSAREDALGQVEVRYVLPVSRSNAKLEIFDVMGRRLCTWGMNDLSETQSIVWDRRDASHHRIQRGAYFLRLEAGSITLTRKLVLINP